MTDFEPEEDLPPVAHVTLVYNGPVAPHWQMQTRYGDQKMLDDFWTRVNARLLLLPKHDPQFRRNRERVNRDAERELIICDWDLGDDDAESTSTPSAMAPAADQQATEAVPVEDAVAAEATPAADESVTADQQATEVVEEPVADAAETAEAADSPADVEAESPVEVEVEVEVEANDDADAAGMTAGQN